MGGLSLSNRQLVVAETNGDCLVRFHVRDYGLLDFDSRFGAFRAPDGRIVDRIVVPGRCGVA